MDNKTCVGAQTSIQNNTQEETKMNRARGMSRNLNKVVINTICTTSRRKMIRKESVNIVSLIIGKGNDRSVSISRQETSRLLDVVGKESIFVTDAKLNVTAQPYAKNFLSVTCNTGEDELLRLLVDNGVYIEFDAMGIKPLSVYTKLSTGDYLRVVGKKAKPSNPEALVFYDMLLFSPSGVKINKWICHTGSEEERMLILYNAVGGNFKKIMVDPFNTGKCSKIIARLSLTMSPSKKVSDDINVAYLDMPFPSKHKNGVDGLGIFNGGRGHFTGQYRIHGIIAKIFGLATDDDILFQELISSLKKTGKLYLPEGVALEDLDVLVDSNGVKLHELELDHITHTYKKTGVNELRLIDMPSENPISTSMQMLEKIVATNPVRGLTLVGELMVGGIEKELIKRFDKESRTPKLGETADAFSKNGMFNYLLKIATEVIHKDKGAAWTTIEQTFDGVRNSINKMAIEVEKSVFARAGADLSYMLFGDEVIYFGEFYSNMDITNAIFFKYPTLGMEEYYVAKNMKGQLVSRVNVFVIKDASKSRAAEAFIRFYQGLGNGVVIMPNSEILRNLLAGFDFDYDGVAMVWDERFLDIFMAKGKKSFVVTIDRKAPNAKEDAAAKYLKGKGYRSLKNTHQKREVELTASVIKETFKKQVLAGGKSIGQITNLNSTEVQIYLSLIVAIAYGNKTKIESLLKSTKAMLIQAAGIIEPGKAKYAPMPRQEIVEDGHLIDNIIADDNFGTELLSRIAMTNLDDLTNILNILLDLNVLRRRQQEGTIDSSKDGLIMKIDLWIDGFKAKSLVKSTFRMNAEDTSVKFERTKQSSKTIVVDGIFSELQDQLIAESEAFGNREFVPLYRESGLSSKEFTELSELIQLHPLVFANLSMVKFLYGRFNNVLMADINRTKEEDIQNELGNKLAESRNVLHGMVSASLNNLDTDTASKLIMAASCYDGNKKVLTNSRQRFAMKVTPELYFHYMINHTPNAVTVETERFYGDITDEYGVVVTLVDGKVNDRFAYGMTKTPFNGEVTIYKVDGKCFAVRKITVERPDVDKVPVVMTKVEANVVEGDHIVFVKEVLPAFTEYKAYKLILDGGVVTGSELVGRFDQRSLVKLSDPVNGINHAYTVKGSIHDSHQVVVNGRENSYVFDCIFVA